MTRVFCTWILVTLAASPFTAPFSTCSVSVLFNRAANAQFDQTSLVTTSGQPSTTLAGKRNDTDAPTDALSVSPVLKKINLSDEAVPSPSTAVQSSTLPSPGLSLAPFDRSATPSAVSKQSAVLRL